MKKLLILITSIILLSCGDRTPIIGGKVPFVVSKIVKYNDTHSEYYALSKESGKWGDNAEGVPVIILPSGLYQINDTITIKYFE